MKPTLWKC